MSGEVRIAARPVFTPTNLPPPEQADSDFYVHDVLTAGFDRPALHGMVFEEYPDGQVVTLRNGGQTSPDGSDIPADAVRNNRVFMFVDGIHTTLQGMEKYGTDLFETANNPARTDVKQPIIGIHEGVGLSYIDEMLRILNDFEAIKAYQAGIAVPGLDKLAYKQDPAVKSVHDEILQSLQAGHDVTLAAHSGGGAESALALTILQHEGYGQAIADHVRLVEFAPAAAPEDFTLAGVRPENLYYTGSHQDPVWALFHNYVQPPLEPQAFPNILRALNDLAHPGAVQYHSPYYIFANNETADGQSMIQQFLDGAPGGDHSF
ncbi:MAG: hypothetical protein ACYCW6_12155 [Candidatus Xenobia bacterium]